MNLLEVRERMKNIFSKKFNIYFEDLDKKMFDEILTDEAFKFRARDLLYLYFFIEKEFDIKIDEKDIIANKFTTINNIIDIVNNTLNHCSS